MVEAETVSGIAGERAYKLVAKLPLIDSV